ncbi:hypothetical protein BDZ97DRAFT_1760559 [Flammula alnicola]|nr:hypothetical protein BDZ97DRAFT_1760559 [Flammula alnicola]
MDWLPPSMPHSLMFSFFLLFSQLTSHGHAKILTQTISDNDFRRHCALELGGYGYDLCPLVESTPFIDGTGMILAENDDQGEGSSSSRRFYQIALGGVDLNHLSHHQGPNLAPSKCDDDTWSTGWEFPVYFWPDECSLSTNMCADTTAPERERADDVERSIDRVQLQSIPIAKRGLVGKGQGKITVSLHIEENNVEQTISPLRLLLDGGQRDDVQSAEIAFFCSEVENLRYVDEDNGVHSFIWATQHGCPRRYPRSTSSEVSVKEEPASDGELPVPEEEKKSDDDLLPKEGMGRTRRLIAIVIVLLVTTLVFGSILFSSTRARHFMSQKLRSVSYTLLPLLSHAAFKLGPIGNSINKLASKLIVRLGSRFRQGESQLVRWAQEDMSLADSEDVMVNGSGAYGGYGLDDDEWNGEGLEEYIPLTISPKYGKGRRVRSYGATPDVETFEERDPGLMSGLGKYFRR